MNESTMSRALPNDMWSKEYFWGCTLSKETPEVMWAAGKTPEDEDEDDEDYMQETLFVRHAVLGVSAVEGERNIVEVETKSFVGEEVVKLPIISLTLGRNDVCQLDLNFSQDIPVKFRLIQGTGPVCLSAQHMIEFSSNTDDDDDDGNLDITEEVEEDEVVDEPVQTGKRKAETALNGKGKRGKVEMNGKAKEEDEEDDDDVDDEMESEGEDDDDEDEDEDGDEDDEDDEEVEEEESPKKKVVTSGKGAKAKAAAPAPAAVKVVKKAVTPLEKKGKKARKTK